MRIQSKRPDRLYTAVPNAAMRDKRLSAEARGTLAYLMSFADEWQFYMSVVADDMGVGRDKLQRIMSELKDAGYVSLEQFRGEGGHLSGSTWIITDNPGGTDCLQTRLPDEPTPGESEPKKNNKQEEQSTRSLAGRDEGEADLFSAIDIPEIDPVDEAIEIYNQAAEQVGWPKCQVKSDKRVSAIRARLKSVAGLEGWKLFVERAAKAPHLIGKSRAGWFASLDWLTNPTNFAKVMEGNYDQHVPRNSGSQATLDAFGAEAARWAGGAQPA